MLHIEFWGEKDRHTDRIGDVGKEGGRGEGEKEKGGGEEGKE